MQNSIVPIFRQSTTVSLTAVLLAGLFTARSVEGQGIDLTIGGGSLGVGEELRYVNALQDDVRLCSRALNAAELQAVRPRPQKQAPGTL